METDLRFKKLAVASAWRRDRGWEGQVTEVVRPVRAVTVDQARGQGA